MNLKQKFGLMMAVPAAGLITLGIFWIWSQRSDSLSEKKEKAKNLVEVPYSVIENQYKLETEGKLDRAEAQRNAIAAIRTMRYSENNYFWVNDEHPTMILHPVKPELEGKDLSSLKDPKGTAVFVAFVGAAQASPAGGFVSYLWPKPGSNEPVPKLSYVKRFAPWGWIVGTGIYVDDVDRAWRENIMKAGMLALACLIPVLVVSLTIGRSMLTRLSRIINQVKDVAEGEGDLTKRIEITSSDEVAELAKWINVFLEKLHCVISSIGEKARNVAATSEEFSAVSQQISANSEETSAQANAVTMATEQVNRGLQTVASATEEMSASIREIAKNTTEAAKIADGAMRTAQETNAIVAKLGESSAEIGQVIKVITSIAQKTDLLALNATVEAARAGEVGAGFAVVANEVKELAKQTAAATEDISRKIETIQADAKGAVHAIGSISEVISQVNSISGTIATAVEEQSATTAEMSRNVAEAAKGAGEVAQNIQGVAQAAQSTSHGATDSQKAAKSLAEMSTHLRELVGHFKLETGKKPRTYSQGGSANRSDGQSRRTRKVEEELAVR